MMQKRILLLQDNSWGGVHTMCQTLEHELSKVNIDITSVQWRHVALRELIKLAGQCDVIVAAHNFGPTYMAILLKWLSRKPVICWVHGPIMSVLAQSRSGWLKRLFLKTIYRQVDQFVCVSRSTENSLLSFIGRPQSHRVEVVTNAVMDLPDGAPLHVHVPHAQDDALPPILLAYIGRLSEEKRPAFLLDTLRALPAQCQLVFIGDGPLRNSLVHHGMDLLQQGRLHFLGKHPYGKSLYTPWHVTLLASRYEGLAMSALESMSCQVPCVALPIPAMRELLDLDAPYLLARGETPVAMAETIMAMLSLPQEQIQADMARIVQRHSVDIFSQGWQKVLAAC
jgi:glycosyltransferase involved in cell wall biosynthesis